MVEHGRAVPRGELADVLWGDAPPATWEKALSVLVSKLRSLLAEAGIDGASALTAAFSCYTLELPAGTWVDVLAAEAAEREAEGFLAADKLAEATLAAELAESLAGSPFLPGDDGPWVEAKRRELAEVRTRALGVLAEASLKAGNPAGAVRWAELAVEAEPFRESGYRRLMEAHITAGNRAEALQVYERCRRLLADELGAYPSPETEAIYRDLLEAPAGRPATGTTHAVSTAGGSAYPMPHRMRPALIVGAVLIALVVIGAAIAVVATRGDGAGPPSAAELPQRIALVLPPASLGGDDSYIAPYLAALNQARAENGVQARSFTIDPALPGLQQSLRQNIGRFGLVLLAGPIVANRFVDVIGRHPHTRFVVMDPPITNNTPLYRAVTRDANADDVFFATGPTAYLAGYLSALMKTRSDPGQRQTVVSMIGSDPTTSQNEEAGFSAGVQAADPRVSVLVDYANDSSDQSVCERIANHQIAEGSTTVYADAGTDCSPGALSAAAAHHVWAIGSDSSVRGTGILASTVKRLGKATTSAIELYLAGDLSRLKHHHFDIGIERGAIALIDFSNAVPARIRTKLAQVSQQMMSTWKTYATPQN